MNSWEYRISKAQSLEDLLDLLGKFLDSDDYIKEVNGEETIVETRIRVDTIGGYKIEIYPNEHPPPHFHVVKNNAKLAAYKIEDCSKLNGELPPNIEKKLKYFYKKSKGKLVRFWKETRPSTT
jgi:hypothetical protein